MTPAEFTQWLDGYLTAIPTNQLDPLHVKIIKEKLDSVFNKVTPPNNYPNYVPITTFIPNYTMIDNGNEPSGIVWSGRNPTPYLGGGFSNYITY